MGTIFHAVVQTIAQQHFCDGSPTAMIGNGKGFLSASSLVKHLHKSTLVKDYIIASQSLSFLWCTEHTFNNMNQDGIQRA